MNTGKRNNQDTHRLMCILAHPDDEALGFGGMLAHYAHQGVATYLITATSGQRGWLGNPEEYPGAEALGRIRKDELYASAEILGVKETTLLDYMDGDLDRAEPSEIINLLVGHLRRVRPQVVLTFDPFGIYGHPDHIAICQFSTAAVMAAANPNYMDSQRQAAHQVSKLYYRAWGLAEAAIYQQVFGDLGMTIDDVKRSATPWHEWAITTRIDATPYWQQVQAAVDSHRSQLGAYERFAALSSEEQRTLWGSQNFYRALSLVNGGREAENDLFMGIAATVDMNSLFTLNGLSEVFRPAVFASSVRS
ncbi:MAG: PIG-L deacetylase family protein [Caldilineaceae bacterium]